jgi:hypothetical protein
MFAYIHMYHIKKTDSSTSTTLDVYNRGSPLQSIMDVFWHLYFSQFYDVDICEGALLKALRHKTK